MGTGEMGTPPKTTKASMSQEQLPAGTAMLYPDWLQAYYNPGTTPAPPLPPGYFHSSVASTPQPPYMWGAQPLIPPYGAPPPPYAAIYHHGGMYAHPSMPLGAHPFVPYLMATSGGATEAAPVGTTSGTDAEGKSSEAKDRSPLKRSKGSLGSLNMLTGKFNEAEKRLAGAGNDTLSQSISESGSEGSSERSDENSQNGSRATQKVGFEQNSAEAAETQNANAISYTAHGGSAYGASGAQALNSTANLAIAAVPIAIAAKSHVVAGPKTNLNIGMDYWNGSCSATSSMRGKLPAVPKTAAMAVVPQSMPLVVPRDGVPSELWLQDERELKRQRRKQSNRESARRSRLRKQAECEELALRAETLEAENLAMRAQRNRLQEEWRKLSTDNAALRKRLWKGPEEEARDTKLGKDGEAGTERQDEPRNSTDSGSDDSLQKDGRREESPFNLDGRNQSLDSRSQAVSVSAG